MRGMSMGVHWGWAYRPGDESGDFLFGSLAASVRFSPFQEPRPTRRFDGQTIYTWPVSVYVAGRTGLGAPRVWEVTAGFETDPLVWIGLPAYGVYELFRKQ